MTNDIISKLNASCREDGPQIWCKCMYCQAGREIRQLRAENKRYKTALGSLWDFIELGGATDLPLPEAFREFVREAHTWYIKEVMTK